MLVIHNHDDRVVCSLQDKDEITIEKALLPSDVGNPNDYYKEDGSFDCIVIINHVQQASEKFGDKELLKRFVLELENEMYKTLKSLNLVLATGSAFYFCDQFDVCRLLEAY